MIVTEQQARKLWCPQMLAYDRKDEDGDGVLDCHCVASACMAWNWWDDKGHGWCGLAGLPRHGPPEVE